ncbi:hypothetical protein OXX79_013722, partial [Metschnikowia pulcherrima]
MQLSFLFAAAAAISSASALGDLGFNLGVKDNEGNCKTTAEYENDFDHLKSYTSVVKTYAVSDCNTLEILGPAAESANFQVMFATELADAIDSVKDLLKSIKDKNGESYESVPVGTVDSWNVLVDAGSTAAIQSADFVFANAFSYWQGQTMQNASYSFFDDIMQALQTIQTVKGSTDIDFWVGETGWPTEGTSFE